MTQEQATELLVTRRRNKPTAVILSCRGSTEFVGWRPIFEFEDIFAEDVDARIVCPVLKSPLPRGLRGIRRRVCGNYALPEQPPDADLLFVVALTPAQLEMVAAVRDWRRRYAKVAAFVPDSFALDMYPQLTSQYDRLFVPIPESAQPLRERFGVPASVLPFAADCVRWTPSDAVRSIDVLSIGRCPSAVRCAFRDAFHSTQHPHLFLHSPIGSAKGPDIWAERAMLMKLYQRTKIALAYDIMIEPSPQRPTFMPIVLPRYFESLAAGCVVVGKRPSTPYTDELFPWEDSLIDLPDDPQKAVDAVLELLGDDQRLGQISRRNAQETRKRHDWRYRVVDVLRQLELSNMPTLGTCDVVDTAQSDRL